MNPITFKIPDREMQFLKWMSQKTGTPVSSIYRNNTLESFQQWKISVLLKEYEKGAIGFKNFCFLANITLLQGMIVIEEQGIEPVMPSAIDEYTESIRKDMTESDLFKKGKIPKRKTPEVNIV